MSILQYDKCIQFLSYHNWRPVDILTFRLGTQNERNPLTFIIRLRIMCVLQYLNSR